MREKKGDRRQRGIQASGEWYTQYIYVYLTYFSPVSPIINTTVPFVAAAPQAQSELTPL